MGSTYNTLFFHRGWHMDQGSIGTIHMNQYLKDLQFSIYCILAGLAFGIVYLIFYFVVEMKKVSLMNKKAGSSAEEVLARLLKKRPEFNDIKMKYGVERRYNHHYIYNMADSTMYLPKNWAEKNLIKNEFWIFYNFLNVTDIRDEETKFFTRSIYPVLITFIGIVLQFLNLLFAFIIPMSIGPDTFRTFWYAMSGVGFFGVFLIILGWIWWVKVTIKVNRSIKTLVDGVIDESDKKNVLKLFKVVRLCPLAINNIFRLAKWEI